MGQMLTFLPLIRSVQEQKESRPLYRYNFSGVCRLGLVELKTEKNNLAVQCCFSFDWKTALALRVHTWAWHPSFIYPKQTQGGLEACEG